MNDIAANVQFYQILYAEGGEDKVGFFKKLSNVKVVERYKMITETGNGFYAWNGKLYESDIVRACIRPRVKAMGKLVAKHIRDSTTGFAVNPTPYIRFLLEEPNPYMTGQVLQEKVTAQLALNNNAFILIVRDDMGLPCELYPIRATTVEAIYDKSYRLFLKFYFFNGRQCTVPYEDIIHIRDDFNENDIFGSSPAKALSELMNIIGHIDQGTVKAIKNSGVIRWLLKYHTPQRPEDLRENVKKFVDDYLSTETDTFGAAGVDAKADAIRIEPKDYVPNADQTDRETERIYAFFNTNKKIVQSSYSEDEWNSYYEARIEPDARQLSDEYTRKLFSRRERGSGNRIIFEAASLQYASMSTKMNLMQMVDRGAMTPNEWRAVMNLGPIENGDKAIRRLDTAVVEDGDKSEDN